MEKNLKKNTSKYVYIPEPLTVHLKLIQHCKSTILQLKKFFLSVWAILLICSFSELRNEDICISWKYRFSLKVRHTYIAIYCFICLKGTLLLWKLSFPVPNIPMVGLPNHSFSNLQP